MLQKGFTLIELMIVVAIIGILSMFALPAYQDYTKRTYVAEGLGLASAAKMAATEYYSSEAKWPTSNALAGLPEPTDIKSGDSVTSVELKANPADKPELVITYGKKVAENKIITLVPDAAAGSVTWKCSGDANKVTVLKKWLPSNCRDQATNAPTEYKPGP
ncbi:pilin [Wohlfahrtiimonas chitiniclastica]|uniref:pilin n=1 Tax=Wohlfahrtiimonas chitiniclastica TaxID=400946 RepID=UPI001BD0C9ED|nr:pilin [Wohlfahrtiimonas chitiniclastica]